jgi:chromosome segregation protein
VEEILSNKSGDRRTALEEAAGVMRYRVRKEEAVRKLDQTRKNLERLQDILQELINQREPLFEQAEKARAYLGLRDELKTLEINVFLYQYERTQERLAAAAATIAQLQEESAALAETERALNADCAVQEENLRALEQTANTLQNELLSMMSGLESRMGEAKVLREAGENLKREQERLKQTLREYTLRRNEIDAAIGRLENNDTAGRDMLVDLDAQIEDTQARLDALQQSIEQQENELEAQKGSIIASLNRLSDAKSQLSRMEAMAAALEQRLSSVREEQAAGR